MEDYKKFISSKIWKKFPALFTSAWMRCTFALPHMSWWFSMEFNMRIGCFMLTQEFVNYQLGKKLSIPYNLKAVLFTTFMKSLLKMGMLFCVCLFIISETYVVSTAISSTIWPFFTSYTWDITPIPPLPLYAILSLCLSLENPLNRIWIYSVTLYKYLCH